MVDRGATARAVRWTRYAARSAAPAPCKGIEPTGARIELEGCRRAADRATA